MRTLTAKRNKDMDGTWTFTCPLHGTPYYEFSEPSNPNLALETLKFHMDQRHPGIKARFMIAGEYVTHTTYTGTTVIKIKGDLL